MRKGLPDGSPGVSAGVHGLDSRGITGPADQRPAPLQNSSMVRLNSCGTSIFTQCPAFSKRTAAQSGSLLFQAFIASNSIGISNAPHPISRGYGLCPVLCLLTMRLSVARNIKDFWGKRRFIAKNSSWACGVYAEIFLFASANHFTEKSALSNISFCLALFSRCIFASK